MKDAGIYISNLPLAYICKPPELPFLAINAVFARDPKTADYISRLWYWVGKSLEAFFSGMPEPILDPVLPTVWQNHIRDISTRYLLYSLLLNRSRGLLKQEAKKIGIVNFDFEKNSELLKTLAFEDFFREIRLSLQNFWESHSGEQRRERASNRRKYLSGDNMPKDIYKELVEKWQIEDTKLHRSDDTNNSLDWTGFSLHVFEKYRRQLLASDYLIDMVDVSGDMGKKFSIIDGRFQPYPGRGSDRSKRKTLTYP